MVTVTLAWHLKRSFQKKTGRDIYQGPQKQQGFFLFLQLQQKDKIALSTDRPEHRL